MKRVDNCELDFMDWVNHAPGGDCCVYFTGYALPDQSGAARAAREAAKAGQVYLKQRRAIGGFDYIAERRKRELKG